MNRAVVTAAIAGSIHTPTLSPYLPVTPEHIIDEILAVREPGGAVCRVHVRNPQTDRPMSDLELFREIAGTVKSCANCPLSDNGCGAGMSAEERVQVVTGCSNEPATADEAREILGLKGLERVGY